MRIFIMQKTKASMMAAAALLATAAALLAGGCSSFQDESSVVDLRVLALAADKPELFVDPSTEVEVITVRALVVDPLGAGRPVSYSAVACATLVDAVTAATGRNATLCPPGSLFRREIIPEATPATVAGDTQHEIQIPIVVLGSEVIPLFSPVSETDPRRFAVLYDLPVTLQLDVWAGDERITTIKRVLFKQQLRLADPAAVHTPNANPVVPGVRVFEERDDAGNLLGEVLPDPDGVFPIPLGAQRFFRPDPAVAESYLARVQNPPTGETVEEAAPVAGTSIQLFPEETLRYTFYAAVKSAAGPPLDPGRFLRHNTSNKPPPIRVQQGEVHLESAYQAPSVMPSSPLVTVWIIARDERTGASWIEIPVRLTP
jgi:hypothetical protein